MKYKNINLLFALAFNLFLRVNYGECARILGIFPVAGKSINILSNRLMKGLADAGHEVVVISSLKNKLPILNGSYTDIHLSGISERYETWLEEIDLYQTPEDTTLWETKNLNDLMFWVYEETFKHPKLLSFIEKKEKFDLVVTEYLWSDSVMAFASSFNCPQVVFTSVGGNNPSVNEMVGNYLSPSYVPHYWMLGTFPNGLNFFARTKSFIHYIADYFVHNLILVRSHQALLERSFPNPPDVRKAFYNVSLVLLGSHSSFRSATPLAPNMVEIGGFHIDPPKKLPKDIQAFLDNAKDGAIFFSMGSHLRSKNFSPEKKQIFLNVFKRLKLKVLWKFEDEVLPGKSDNVMIRKWLPQMDILGHPNVKLFISHAGYGSTLETIYHGMPSLMIPVFFDQFNNAQQSEERGFALKLSYSDKNFTEATLYSLIREMLDNPVYMDNAKEASRLFHDRPMKPMESAVYWVEYILRHKGARHLRLKGLDLPWYQFYMLDVISFLLLVLIVIVYILKKVITLILELNSGKNVKKLKKN
ncbi:UDP-glycosyltransferase UGT5-like [Anthonomus grandis grandis]|uniref:UDP-glycosyltransferase UGT5-like n=1 Tax=Anthonomus grandis grandis TaxID=2921223 RepID=UPI00216509F6|nr:UDP-glycosyltransferase UGT5-like [Anthonomus grandis grandis]